MIDRTTAFWTTGVALLVLFAGCSSPADESATTDPRNAGPIADDAQLPPDHPPLAAGQDRMPPPVAPGAGGMAWEAPESWIAESPANNMRQAQYRVPGPGGDGEFVVFYFGPGQGGDAAANVLRWASQFTQPDDSPSAEHLRTDKFEVGGIQVMQAEVSGTYQSGGPMMGGAGKSLPGHMLLGAVAQGADANWFFKFTGPRATVEANRAAFGALLGSLRSGSS